MSEKKKDEQEPEGRAAEAPREIRPARRADQSPVKGGATIRGGVLNAEDGKHYGGVIQDANGKILDSFEDDEENTGIPRRKAKAEGELSPEELKAQAEQATAERDAALKTVADQQTQLADLQAQLQRAEEDARMTGFSRAAEVKSAPKNK